MKPERTDTTRVGRLAADRAETLSTNEDLVVVSWNVHKALDTGLPDELRALVEERAPQIVALQEARLDLALPDGYAGHHATSFRRGLVGPEEGVMTIANAPIDLAHRVRSVERELLVLTPKAALITTFPLDDGRHLCLVNVHGLNFDPSGRQLARQLEGLRALVEHLDGPLVIAGDFNTWNEPRMKAVLDLAAALDLFEVFPDYPGGKKGHAPSARVRRALGIDRRLHLDRLYVRGLRPVHAAWLEHFECSDHVALLSRLAWS
ncbi:MAG: endonuclease/exonuclease/phosphatase family protein [Planctomycetota bacterium]